MKREEVGSWRAKLDAARQRAALAKQEAQTAAAHAAEKRDVCIEAEARRQARSADAAAAQSRAEVAIADEQAAKQRLTASSKRTAAAVKAAEKGAAQRPQAQTGELRLKMPREPAQSAISSSSGNRLEADCKPLAKPTVRPAARAGAAALREAEVQALVEKKEQRRAEIHALNTLLRRALTGKENDP